MPKLWNIAEVPQRLYEDVEILIRNLRISIKDIFAYNFDISSKYPMEFCDGHVLYYVMSGLAKVVVDSKIVDVASGTSILMPCNQILTLHSVESRQSPFSLVGVTIATDGDYRAGFLECLDGPLFWHDDSQLARHAYGIILHGIERPRIGNRAIAEALAKAIIVKLLECNLEGSCMAGQLRMLLTQPHLARAVNYISGDPGKRHTIESLARLADIAPSELIRKFDEVFQQSPMEYIREIRLARAEALLSDTNLPVKTIAGMIGFGSRSHFSRLFCKHKGTDPTTFRQQQASMEQAEPAYAKSAGSQNTDVRHVSGNGAAGLYTLA